MKWENFRRLKESVYFGVEVTYSIYMGAIECRSSLDDLKTFEKELADLYERQRGEVRFFSRDALLSLFLQWSEYGHIRQSYLLADPQNRANFLRLNFYFDQSFLTELQESIQQVIEALNEGKRWMDLH